MCKNCTILCKDLSIHILVSWILDPAPLHILRIPGQCAGFVFFEGRGVAFYAWGMGLCLVINYLFRHLNPQELGLSAKTLGCSVGRSRGS